MELFKSKRKAENEPRPREEGEEEEVFLKRSKLEVLAGLELTAKRRVSESCRKAVSFRFVSSRLVSSIFSSLLFSSRFVSLLNVTQLLPSLPDYIFRRTPRMMLFLLLLLRGGLRSANLEQAAG